jgi:hypothetical protein
MKEMLSALARNVIRSPTAYARLKHMYKAAKSRVHSHDLPALATIHGSDKWGSHWYTPHYERPFKPLRWKKLKILEIGVRNGPRNLDSPLSEIFPEFQAANLGVACSKYTASGGRRSSAL